MQVIRFSVLNPDPEDNIDTSEPISKEVEVEKCLETYKRILQQQYHGELKECKVAYENLLQKAVFSEVLPEVQRIQDSPMHTLHFVANKNYAQVLEKLGDKSLAVNHYKKAAEVDPSDASSWIKVGDLSLEMEDYSGACIAYDMALKHASTVIEYWSALDGLCAATYEVGDYNACLRYLDLALADNPDYLRGELMRSDISKERQHQDIGELLYSFYSNEAVPDVPRRRVPRPTGLHGKVCESLTVEVDSNNWADLGVRLTEAYEKRIPQLLSNNLEKYQVSGSHMTAFSFETKIVEPVPMEDVTVESMASVVDEPQGDAEQVDQPAAESTEVPNGEKVEAANEEEHQSDPESPPARKRRRGGRSRPDQTRVKRAKVSVGRAEEAPSPLQDTPSFLESINAILPTSMPLSFGDELFSKLVNLSSIKEDIAEYESPATAIFIQKLAELFNDNPKQTFHSLAPLLKPERSYDNKPTSQDTNTSVEFAKDFGEFTIHSSESTSGLVDIMRDYLIKTIWTLETKSSEALKILWSDKLRDALTTILLALESLSAGSNIVYQEARQRMNAESISDSTSHEGEKFLRILLYCTEILFDYVVIEKSLDLDFDPGFETEHRQFLWQAFNNWWGRLSVFAADYPSLLSNLNLEARVRLFWLQGRVAEMVDDPEKATANYMKCLDLVSQETDISLFNCKKHSRIRFESIVSGLRAMSVRQYVLNSEASFESEDYEEVIKRLQPTFSTSLEDGLRIWKCPEVLISENVEARISANGEAGTESQHRMTLQIARDFAAFDLSDRKRLRLLEILWEAHKKMGNTLEAVRHEAKIVLESCKQVIKSSDTYATLEKLGNVLHILNGRLIEEWTSDPLEPLRDNHEVVLDIRNDYCQFVAAIYFAVQLSWRAMRKLHIPGYKKSPIFLKVILESWTSLFFVCRSLALHQHLNVPQLDIAKVEKEIEEESKANDILRDGAELNNASELGSGANSSRQEPDLSADVVGSIFTFAHEQLGEISICTVDNVLTGDTGKFLKLGTKYFRSLSQGYLIPELYQCYCCLYGVTATIDSSTPLMEHDAPGFKFDKEAATEMFEVLSPYVVDRLSSNNTSRAVSYDTKVVLDQISDFFEELPSDNARAQYNKKLIDTYITSPIDFTGNPPWKCRPVAAFTFEDDDESMPSIYKQIFHIRGKLQWLQLKPKPVGVKTTKSFENLELAAEEFLNNIYVNPNDYKSWLYLAQVYFSASNEFLGWSANEIIASFDDICKYQKKAFHCFSQAHTLFAETRRRGDGSDQSTTVKELSLSLWANLGFLCYSMATKPICGMPMKSHLTKVHLIWKDRLNLLEASDGRPNTDSHSVTNRTFVLQLLRIALWCFKRASKFDPNEWQYQFMLAKILAKSGAKPETIVSHYRQAIALVPENWATKEQEIILDPRYGLCSFLTKALFAGRVTPDFVLATMRLDIEVADQDDKSKKLLAYQHLLKELEDLRHIDKKKWQHKPIWRLVFLLKNVFFETEKAKDELLGLFQLKSLSRLYTNFWRPEFERPGKHFAYINKYVTELISLLKHTKDIENLRNLLRKIRKAEDTLLYPQAIWNLGYNALLHILSEGFDYKHFWQCLFEKETSVDLARRAPEFEKLVFAVPDPKPHLVQCINAAVQLRKLNEADEDEEELCDIIVGYYSKLYLDTYFHEEAAQERLQEAFQEQVRAVANAPALSETVENGTVDKENILAADAPAAVENGVIKEVEKAPEQKKGLDMNGYRQVILRRAMGTAKLNVLKRPGPAIEEAIVIATTEGAETAKPEGGSAQESERMVTDATLDAADSHLMDESALASDPTQDLETTSLTHDQNVPAPDPIKLAQDPMLSNSKILSANLLPMNSFDEVGGGNGLSDMMDIDVFQNPFIENGIEKMNTPLMTQLELAAADDSSNNKS
ncbi:Histone transcription regulator 3 [Chytridiales sp. JEL 0842]|nr:Histone transcription regulator 3 [Chytridiales sp. JEL 0842]